MDATTTPTKDQIQEIDDLNGLMNVIDADVVFEDDEKSRVEAQGKYPVFEQKVTIDEPSCSMPGDNHLFNLQNTDVPSPNLESGPDNIVEPDTDDVKNETERTSEEVAQLLNDCLGGEPYCDNEVSRSPSLSEYHETRESMTQEDEQKNEHNGTDDHSNECHENKTTEKADEPVSSGSESGHRKRKSTSQEGSEEKKVKKEMDLELSESSSDESDLETEKVVDESLDQKTEDTSARKKKKTSKKSPNKESPKKNGSSLRRKNIKMVKDEELDEQVSQKRKEEEERIKRQNQAMESLKEQMKKVKEEKKLTLESMLSPVKAEGDVSSQIDEICLSSDDEEDSQATRSLPRPFPGQQSNRTSILDHISNISPYQRSILSQFSGNRPLIQSSPIATGINRSLLSQFSGNRPLIQSSPVRSGLDQSPGRSLLGSISKEAAEARNEIIELDDEDIHSSGKWKYGTEHQYTDDDFAGEEDDDENNDLDEDGNPCGLFADDRINTPDDEGLVLVNVGHSSSEKPIYLPPQIADVIKPHQIGGIRFMWANIVESLEMMKKSDGVGCILAHAMGLGKTIQIVAFTHVFLTQTLAKHVLIIVPINTLQNWVAEFNQWTPSQPKITDFGSSDGHGDVSTSTRKNIKYRTFNIYELSDQKDIDKRCSEVKKWRSTGGVMLIGYEMYRILTDPNTWSKNSKTKSRDLQIVRKMLKEIREALVNPGPDLIVCDEGHRIKNDATGVSKAVKEIRTKRRIVLTGYPLQNNLMEYWCMVDFVRPGYLGSKDEFSNRFEKPIKNGQFVDSRQQDKDTMRRRAFVLADLLKGFVQRRSHDILCSTLPKKHELVVLLRMTDIQKKLFEALFEHLKTNGQKMSPIILFSVCNKIWNHPDILYSVVKEGLSVEDMDEEMMVGGLNGNRGKNSKKGKGCQNTCVVTQGSTVNPKALDLSWAEPVFDDYVPNVVENSHKMVLLFELIDRTIQVGEKILVFSQSLLTLNIIEHYLSKRFVPAKLVQSNDQPSTSRRVIKEEWTKGINYYRIDGSVNGMDRNYFINSFNKNPKFKLFLLSTKAGCLGVNLVGASRIVIFDVSWNPCHDAQAACRIYRYGQTKETHIYRLVADMCLEKKVFDRCISKQGISNRVVDEENPETILLADQIRSLVEGLDVINEPEVRELDPDLINRFDDQIIQIICQKYYHMMTKEPFKHESLLLHDRKTALSKNDKITAKKQYEHEKNMRNYNGGGRNNWSNGPPMTSMFSGIDYRPPEPRNIPFKPLAELDPKWPVVKAKLDAKQYTFLKRSQMPQQLKLQDKVTGEPNFIEVGEEVDFFRNPNQETLLVTHDCKVVEVRGNLINSLNVDSLARSNLMQPDSNWYQNPPATYSRQPQSLLVPSSTYTPTNHLNSQLPPPPNVNIATIGQQFPRRIDPATSLPRHIRTSSDRPLPSNASAAIASMYNPFSRGPQTNVSLLPANGLQPTNGGMVTNQPILPSLIRPQPRIQPPVATVPPADPVIVDLSDDE